MTGQGAGGFGIGGLILAGVMIVIAVAVCIVLKRRQGPRDDDMPISVMETVPDEGGRGRPDLRVKYGDPARQYTEVEDEDLATQSADSPLIVGAAQIIGQREDQEDAYGYTEWRHMDTVNRKGFMAVMADGIGGLQDGQVASQAAVRGAMEMFDMQLSDEPPAERVLEITAAAQRSVLMDSAKAGSDCGCTFLCVLVHDLEMSLASVGDSKIALYRSGVLLQLNREHVLGREVDENNILAGERRVVDAKRRKAITAYLGKRELRTIDRTLHPMQLVSGDRILLMSDGIFNTLGDDTLIAYLDQPPQAAAEAIVQAVNGQQVQGQDNATIVIVGVK